MNVTMKSDDGLTWLIILLVFVIVYLLYNSDYSIYTVVDEVSDILDTGSDSSEESDEKNIEIDEKAAYDPKSNDPYTVSVGNPKDITRCKKLPTVSQVEQIDFSYKPMYTPNSRGNVCNKGDIEESALFPTLTNEKALDNVDTEGNIVMPVASFDGTEAPFVANCTFSKPSCANSISTLIPGEILVKESVEPGSTEGPKDTVEGFENYYEGFIEGAVTQSTMGIPAKNTVFFIGSDSCAYTTDMKATLDAASDLTKVGTDGKAWTYTNNNKKVIKIQYIDGETKPNNTEVDGYPTLVNSTDASNKMVGAKKWTDVKKWLDLL